VETLKSTANTLKQFFRSAVIHRSLLVKLSVRELKSSNFGSAFGTVWVFVEPTLYIFLMWAVFEVGMNYKISGNRPYLPWLMSGMIGWNLFSSGNAGGTSVFRSYSYLVSRTDIDMSILPLIKILSYLYVHAIFIALTILLLLVSGGTPSPFILQIPYYTFCTAALILGMNLFFASLYLFLKDVGNIVGVFLQIGFWVSPIFWDFNLIPARFHWLLKLNPLVYIITGYRDSLIDGVPFWAHTKEAVFFWAVTTAIIFIGAFTHSRLRPHFGDVL
jgi:ABC-type polysaccharide/polyol phosphate export permease